MRKLPVLLCLLMLTGCFTAAKQAYYTAVGPQGQYLMLEQHATAAEMARYQGVEVGDFVNEIPSAIKVNVAKAVQRETVRRLIEMDAKRMEEGKLRRLTSVRAVDRFQQGSPPVPTLFITGRLLDITSDKIPGQKIVMGGNHLIARAQVIDKATGKVLADVNLRGVVKSAADWDEESLAEGMAKGVQSLLGDLCGWKDRDKETQ
jgi:hypothetical protein